MKRCALSLPRLAIYLCCFWAMSQLKVIPAASQQVRVEPRASQEVFANPGMGWQTFHRFADEDKNLAGLPSSCAYFRFYWREIEPKDGQIDFSHFDDLLAHARRAGQLAIGVVDPNSQAPAVRLAIEGRDAEGWYPLSRVESD